MVETKTLLANRYWLDQQTMPHLTREAWQARDLVTGQVVMVWCPRLSAACTERFLAAAAHTARIRHPGIARILDVGLAAPEGTPFVVTEMVGGTPLIDIMQAGPLDPSWTLDVVRQVTSALSAAQDSGLHLVINPWSVGLAVGGSVKVASFALKREAGCPSGAHGNNLYQLGLVTWACLTGKLPTGGTWHEEAAERDDGQAPPHLSPLPATVPEGIATLAADLTTAGAAARPASAAEIHARCRELLTAPMRVGQPAEAGPPGRTPLLDARPPGNGSGR